jgi:hypothetical protein
MKFLKEAEVVQLTIQLLRGAGAEGMTEDEVDAALDEMEQVAASASLWVLWKQNRVTVRWDAGAGALRFVSEGVE